MKSIKFIKKISQITFVIIFSLRACLKIVISAKYLKNKIVLVGWHWSFGHQAQMLECIARTYNKSDKILLFQTIYSVRNNKYLYCLYNDFYEKIDSFESKSKFLCHINYISLKIIFKYFLKNFVKELIFYEDFYSKYKKIYKIPQKKNVYHFDETSKNLIKNYPLQIWVDEILKNYKFNHALNNEFKKKIDLILKKNKIELEKKIVTFFFREYQNSNTYYDKLRNSYNILNYIESIKYFSEKNYNIFIFGPEKNNDITKLIDLKIKNTFIFFNQEDNDYKMINIYALYKSIKIISQNSAPQMVGGFLGNKGYVVDYCPPFFGFPERVNIMMPKILINKQIKYFKDYKNSGFFWGQQFDKENSFILANSSSEILNFLSKDLNKFQTINHEMPEGSAFKIRKNNFVYCSSYFE